MVMEAGQVMPTLDGAGVLNCKVYVAMVSHPPVLEFRVRITVPGWVYPVPPNVMVSPGQKEIASNRVGCGSKVSVYVTIVSQALADAIVSITIPDWLKICPPIVTDSPGQKEMLSDRVGCGNKVSVYVTMVSQAVADATVSITIPDWLKICPPIVTDSLGQNEMLSERVGCGSNVSVYVTMVSQAVADAIVSITVPDWL